MTLRPYMREVSQHADEHGMMILFWRRQSGKTTWFGWRCLKGMAKVRGSLHTLVSASLNVGSVLTEKEAKVWQEIIAGMRKEAEQGGFRIETTADKLQWDDYLDMLDKSKLEVKLYHDRTSYSRTKIIAPNVATARGYSGWVYLDEFGFIPDFRAIFEAVEPIASSDPSFRLLMATTPPEDDAHYSYELTIPALDAVFNPNARGNWYTSQAGLIVHRVDAWDAELVGVHLYDRATRKPISPEEHRAQALDRNAWDRNYGLQHIAGGSAACSLLSLQGAQTRGAATCIAAEDDFPPGWTSKIRAGLPTAIGLDPATTEEEKSNPTGLTIAQRDGARALLPLILRFKTADDRKQKAILREAIEGVRAAGARLTKVGLDASNERYFCQQVRRDLAGIVPVDLFVAAEIPGEQEHLPPKERQNYKTLQGNLLVNLLDDHEIDMPADRWVKDDFRLVLRNKGGFSNRVDAAGNHGDTFDSSKIAVYEVIGQSGVAFAEAVQVGENLSPEEKPRDFWIPNADNDCLQRKLAI